MRTEYYNYLTENYVNFYTTIKITTSEERAKLMAIAERFPEHTVKRVTLRELRELSFEERMRRINEPRFAGYFEPWKPVSVDNLFADIDDLY